MLYPIVVFRRCSLLFTALFIFALLSPHSRAQITLSGNNYFENFDGIAGGLPAGWSVRTNASAFASGSVVPFNATAATWAATSFDFKNLASTISNTGTNFNGAESTAIQNAATNRSLAIRQTSGISGGDPGAAFAMEIQNTAGLANFQLTLDFNMLSVQPRSTSWTVDYGIGENPATYISVGTNYTDPDVFGTTTRTVSFGEALNNHSQPVWIRIVALAGSTGSGSRDTFGIDNFNLSYEPFAGIAPSITNQPNNQTVIEGETARFTVGASGTAPFFYQWFFNGTNLLNATSSSLLLSNVTFNHAGGYSALVTNYYGGATSAVAQLNINPAPPLITVQPQSQTAPAGTNVSFSISASGMAPLTYQWFKGNAAIIAATNSVLTLTNITTADMGSYACVVTNPGGSSSSEPAQLTISINTVRVITYNVKGNSVSDFSTNTAQVQAIGRQLVYLQPDIVTFNEIPLGQTHQVTNIVRQYLPGYFWATNSATDGYIRSAILSRWQIKRSQRWLNSSSLIDFGYDGTFTRDLFEAEIDVPGFGEPFHVFTTHLKSGSDSDSSSRRAAEAGAISNYFVAGFLTTNSARPYVLTGDLNEDVARPPSNSKGPIQKVVNTATGLQLTTPLNPVSKDERTFSVQSLPLQRRYDYILPSEKLFPHILSSQVFRTDLLNPTPPELNSNDSPTASDHLPVLMEFNNPFVQHPLYIIRHPASRTNNEGTTAMFSVQVNGVEPFTFQWIKNGTNFLSDGGNVWGAGASNLTLFNVSQAEAGSYSVWITNALTNVFSASATLTVIDAPVITSQPAGSTNLAGGSATFSVTVAGTSPFSFQWQFNGENIAGATNSTYTKTNLQIADDGCYSVVVSNPAGIALSNRALLKVAGPLVLWNFNSETPDANSATGTLQPAIGSGTAELIGGTTGGFAAGHTSDPANAAGDNSGWNTSGYPLQGTANKSAGVQFSFSTIGFENISISFDQRVSSTASRYYRLQYSTNGTAFTDFGGAIAMNANTVFENRFMGFASVPGANNNPDFRVRIVSEWESTAAANGNGNYVGTGSNYGTGGTVRFDMVKISGTAIPESEPPILSDVVLGPERFSFRIHQPVDRQVRIQISSNLVDWISVLTNTVPFTFDEERSIQIPRRFYRSVFAD